MLSSIPVIYTADLHGHVNREDLCLFLSVDQPTLPFVQCCRYVQCWLLIDLANEKKG